MFWAALISPMDGMWPGDLQVDTLIERLKDGGVKEIIFALSATMEGDTTIFYLHKRLKQFAYKYLNYCPWHSFWW
jgi:recombination protein RecR